MRLGTVLLAHFTDIWKFDKMNRILFVVKEIIKWQKN